MGAGHGSWIPFLLSSAPLSVASLLDETSFQAAVIGGAPVVWTVFGALVSLPDGVKGRRLIQLMILLQYASGLALIGAATGFGELAHMLDMLRISPEVVVAWAVVYLGGQLILWWQIVRRGEPGPD